MADLIGATVGGKYRVLSKIGTGSMGDVFEAQVVGEGGHYVALKVLKLDDETIAARFLREAKTMALFQHPNIVELLEVGKLDDGRLFFAAELVRGETLRKLLEAGEPLDTKRVLGIVRQVANALGHAHAMGVVHRDIKPENTMLVDGDLVKILDFGVAKLIGDTPAILGEGTLTITGYGALGTPYYISPEAVLGRPLDARADIYSMGVMLYELLTGRPPYMHDDVAVLMRMHAAAPIPKLADHAPDRAVTPELELVVSEALAKKPELRFKSAAEMIDAIDAAIRSLDLLPKSSKATDLFGALPMKAPAPPAEPSASRPVSFSPSSIPSASQPVQADVDDSWSLDAPSAPVAAPSASPATISAAASPAAMSAISISAPSQPAAISVPSQPAAMSAPPPPAAMSAPSISAPSQPAAISAASPPAAMSAPSQPAAMPAPVAPPAPSTAKGPKVPLPGVTPYQTPVAGSPMVAAPPPAGPAVVTATAAYPPAGPSPGAAAHGPSQGVPSPPAAPPGASTDGPLFSPPMPHMTAEPAKLGALAQQHRNLVVAGIGVVILTAVVLTIVLVSGGGKKSAAAGAVATAGGGATSASTPRTRELTQAAQQHVAAGLPQKALEVLEGEDLGNDADAYAVLGHARITSNRRLDGLGAYERAIALDAKYRTDPQVRANVERVLEGRDAAAAIVAIEIGLRLEPRMEDHVKKLAETSKHNDIRRRALWVAQREKFVDRIDGATAWSLDLTQSATCEERLAAVQQLKRVGDAKALPALRKAKSHRCVEREVAEAIAQIENATAPSPAPEPSTSKP